MLSVRSCTRDGEAGFFPQQFADLAAQAQFHGALLQGQTQHVGHAVGLVGEGIDPPVGLLYSDQAQTAEEGQGLVHAEARQGGADEAGIAAVVVFACRGAVGEVAPAVAGGHELAAQPGLALIENHPCAPAGVQRRHHARGAAADDADDHNRPSHQ